jgi:hypothetical protein
VREHLEDRFFWVVLWAFVASVGIAVGRSNVASTYVGSIPSILFVIGIIGFLVCVARSIWRRAETPLEYILGVRHSTMYRVTGEQVAILFVLTALIAGLGPAVLLLMVASIFARED